MTTPNVDVVKAELTAQHAAGRLTDSQLASALAKIEPPPPAPPVETEDSLLDDLLAGRIDRPTYRTKMDALANSKLGAFTVKQKQTADKDGNPSKGTIVCMIGSTLICALYPRMLAHLTLPENAAKAYALATSADAIAFADNKAYEARCRAAGKSSTKTKRRPQHA